MSIKMKMFITYFLNYFYEEVCPLKGKVNHHQHRRRHTVNFRKSVETQYGTFYF